VQRNGGEHPISTHIFVLMILTVVAISIPSPLSSDCSFLFKYNLCSIKQITHMMAITFIFACCCCCFQYLLNFYFGVAGFFFLILFICVIILFLVIFIFFPLYHEILMFLFSLVWRGENSVLEVYVRI
jgi:hypothetical protein